MFAKNWLTDGIIPSLCTGEKTGEVLSGVNSMAQPANRQSWIVVFTCGNLFSKNNQTWEFIFEEKGLFETSENKNPSKMTSYTVSI